MKSATSKMEKRNLNFLHMKKSDHHDQEIQHLLLELFRLELRFLWLRETTSDMIPTRDLQSQFTCVVQVKTFPNRLNQYA